jgi:hypothetical protein
MGATAKIVASDRTAFDNFGNSVAISGDYAIVAQIAKVTMPLATITSLMPAQPTYSSRPPGCGRSSRK